MRNLRPAFGILGLLLLGGCGGGSGAEEDVAADPTGVVVVPAPAPAPTPTPAPAAPTPVGPNTMVLGAATAFGQQAWDFSILQTARSIGVMAVRDGVAWTEIEKTPGVYQFTSPGSKWMETVINNGFPVTLLFDDTNPLYDGGKTPHTDQGRAAYAKYIVATLDRFPKVKTIEIGNEYNAFNFVSGPVRDEGYGARQRYYFETLKTVYRTVKASHPDVKILGGAGMAIPVGYFKPLFGMGALDYMDGIVVHPYTTDPEQLAKQLGVLRAAMGAAAKPIHVTEFAQELDSIPDTANYLVKSIAVMASAGVAEADWYALRQQGGPSNIWYKNVALASFAGDLLPPGQAFKVMSQQVLAKGAGRRIAVDDFTYAYQFGQNAMVVWGEPRSLSVKVPARFYNAQGLEIAAPAAIEQRSPIIIVSDQPLAYGQNVSFGDIRLVADSYDQFDFTNSLSGETRFEGPWSYFSYAVRRQAYDMAYTQGGGEISSSDWMPYIGIDWLRPFNINANTVGPVDYNTGGSPDAYKAVLRYTSPHEGRFDIQAVWDVVETSDDGIDLQVQVNAQTVFATTVARHYDMNLKNLSIKQGDIVSVVVGPNKNAIGTDTTKYRIKIYRTS